MNSDQLLIRRLECLDDVPLKHASQVMQSQLKSHPIGCVNWPTVADYKPEASFCVASSSNALFVHFNVVEEGLRAMNTENRSPVAEDSCVEFFLQTPGSEEYWNFEFNCIGTLNASHRKTRPQPVRLSDQQMASVGRFASLGSQPFEKREGQNHWTLTIRIPFDLIGLDASKSPAAIKANVYKCGSKAQHPHYLSWMPIHTQRPDFHQPSAFGTMNLEEEK